MKTQRKVHAAAAALALLLTLNACSTAAGGEPSASSTELGLRDISEGVQPDPKAVSLLPQSYKDKGELTVAADLHYPPTVFLAEDNKTPIGLNPDITRLIAKKLGVKVKFVDTKFDTIIPGLDGGRYDFTVSTMAKTDERLKVVDMIDYFKAGSSIGVTRRKPAEPHQRDLVREEHRRHPGLDRSAVAPPGPQRDDLRLQGTAGDQRRDAAQRPGGPGPAASKRIDGILYDTTALAWAQKQQPGSFQMLTPPLNVGGTGITAVALKKGSPLTPAMQAAIQSILATPEYEESLKTWGLEFGAITDAKLN